jgi:hypothetical protein
MTTIEKEIERIALAYKEATDDFIVIHEQNLHNFRQLIQAQFAELSQTIYFDFVDTDPYPYKHISELMPDFRKRIIKVNTSGNDSRLWGKVYNLQFRAIHDWIHCMNELDFNYEAEVKAYDRQIGYSLAFKNQFHYINWALYAKILKSEIVYQAAVKEYFKEFHIDQKIILHDL